MKSLKLLQFKHGPDTPRARHDENDVQLIYPGGEVLTIQLLGIKDGRIRGKSENFTGELSFDEKAFAGLKFHLHKEDVDHGVLNGFWD